MHKRFFYKSKITVTIESFQVQDGRQGKYEAILVKRPSSHGFYFSEYLNVKPSERYNHPKAAEDHNLIQTL
jgi:hypothetical protein